MISKIFVVVLGTAALVVFAIIAVSALEGCARPAAVDAGDGLGDVPDWCKTAHLDPIGDRQLLCIHTVNRPTRDGGR